MRGGILVVMVMSAALAGCSAGAESPRSLVAETATPSPSPATTTATTAAPAATAEPEPTFVPTIAPPDDVSPAGVALPTCGDPEVRPEWWTPTCADAGYQIDLTWDTWTSERATANAVVTGKPLDGSGPYSGKARVVADRPRRAADGRYLYTRVVVTHEKAGPYGTRADTFDAWDMWQTYVSSVETANEG